MRSRYKDSLADIENGSFGHRMNENGDWEYTTREGKTVAEALEEYQEQANRLNAIGGVYQRADRIITGNDIVVEVVNDPNMPSQAGNTGKKITFNSNMIDELDEDSLIALHGLNYHELAHIMFSPRAGSDLAQYVRTNKLTRSFFILEESRAENMLVTKYPITRLFLESTVNRYLMRSNNIGAMFPLVTGRKYLPIELRQAVADFALNTGNPDEVRDIHSIVHEYRTLVFPRDFDKAKSLIERLGRIVGNDEMPNPEYSDTGHTEFLKEGRPANTQEQDKLQGRSGSKGEPTEDMGGDHKGFGEGGADPDKVLMLDEHEFTEKDTEVANLINERMKAIKSDKFVKREVSDTRKAIFGSDETRVAMRDSNYEVKPISPASQVLARKFGQELQRLVRDQDPEWEMEKPYGKLITKRTMHPDINNIGRVFDRWNIGNENTDIEAVILIDHSVSMGSLTRKVSENAWVIKRAIEAIQGKVTVYSYNHESKLLYSSDERAKPNEYRHVWAQGNTNPIRALIESERVFSASRRSIKLLFAITDGEWSMDNECDSIIARMKDKGVLTTLVYLDEYENIAKMKEHAKEFGGGDEDNYYTNKLRRLSHGVNIFRAVTQPKDILTIAQDLVKELITNDRRVA